MEHIIKVLLDKNYSVMIYDLWLWNVWRRGAEHNEGMYSEIEAVEYLDNADIIRYLKLKEERIEIIIKAVPSLRYSKYKQVTLISINLNKERIIYAYTANFNEKEELTIMAKKDIIKRLKELPEIYLLGE